MSKPRPCEYIEQNDHSLDLLPGCGIEFVHWLSNTTPDAALTKSTTGNPIILLQIKQAKQHDVDIANDNRSPGRRSTIMMRVCRCLAEAQIDSFEKLQAMTPNDWANFRQFGRKAHSELKLFAEEHGVKIASL